MNAETVSSSAAEISALAVFGKTAAALLFIVLLILLCGWLFKRLNLRQQFGAQRLRVISSVMVGPRERVVIVAVEDTWLVLGVASGQVSKLHELPAAPMPPPATQSAEGSFATRFGRALKSQTLGSSSTDRRD